MHWQRGLFVRYDDAYGLCPNCGYKPDTDVDSPIHMQPGVVLHGRYLIGKVLGFGGFGVTYIGWDFTLQQKVAIKEYLPSEFATRMIDQTQVTVFGGKKEEQFDDGMEKFVEEGPWIVLNIFHAAVCRLRGRSRLHSE